MNSIKNFNSAVSYISKSLRSAINSIPENIKSETYEIRLRTMRPVSLVGAYGTIFIENENSTEKYLTATAEDVKDTFNRICSFSIHSFRRFINSGYIPMDGGNRAGVCGTAVCENKIITSVKDITSINIRISREVFGCADEILRRSNDIESSVIIAGPPSSGKTTIVRDIVRQISSGRNGNYIKTAVIDERREISGIVSGIITNDIGFTSDVLDSYPKSEAIDIAVRTLSPQVIVCDEISTQYEIESIKSGINCGAKFVVTVHAGSEEELFTRRQIEELLSLYSFKKIFLLSGTEVGQIIKEYDAGEILNEISLRRIGCGSFDFSGNI